MLTCTLAKAQFSDDYLFFRLGGEDGYVFYYDGSGNPAVEGGGKYTLQRYCGKYEETHMTQKEFADLVVYLSSMTTRAKIEAYYGVEFSGAYAPNRGFHVTIYDPKVHKAWERSEKERLAREKRMLENKFNSVIFGK